MTEYTVSGFALITDNGDGGFSARVFNTEQERLDHMNSGWGKKKLTAEDVANGDYDEYERGYADEVNISIVVDENGNAKLKGELYFHGGQ